MCLLGLVFGLVFSNCAYSYVGTLCVLHDISCFFILFCFGVSCQSDGLSNFKLNFTVCSYVVLLHKCLRFFLEG